MGKNYLEEKLEKSTIKQKFLYDEKHDIEWKLVLYCFLNVLGEKVYRIYLKNEIGEDRLIIQDYKKGKMLEEFFYYFGRYEAQLENGLPLKS